MLSMMLALSLVLGDSSIAGSGMDIHERNDHVCRCTVDGLFMSLILLTLSGIFMLNAYWEMRDRGMLGKKKAIAPAAKSPAAKAS